MKTRSLLLLLIGLALAGGCQPLATQSSAELLPRATLFGAPDRASVQLSPDGEHISYLAPVDGVLNVWVAPRADLDRAKPITQDTGRGIRNYNWAMTSEHILFTQDTGGDENWRLYVVDIASGQQRDLTPFDNTQARIQQVSFKHPSEILVGINNRNPQLHDIYRVDLQTGERALVLENPGFAGFVVDDDFNVRYAFQLTPDGGAQVLARGEDGEFTPAFAIPAEDVLTTAPVMISPDGSTLYLTDSRGRDRSALIAWSTETGEQRVLAEDAKADVANVLFHPTERTPQIVSFEYLQEEWKALPGSSYGEDLEALQEELGDGEISIASRTQADDAWVVAHMSSDAPVRYYIWDRENDEARYLFPNRTALEGKTLAKMHPRVIRSRDGLELVSYLSLPPGQDGDGDGVPAAALPMVLLVHGGPWARDSFGYNSLHQLLANRGYAVLSVNFRGSPGADGASCSRSCHAPTVHRARAAPSAALRPEHRHHR
ncbi:MAG: S9 family peptidase, partial [Planctomycetota bacterium]